MAEVGILAEIMSAGSLECLAGNVTMILFHCLNQASIAGRVVEQDLSEELKVERDLLASSDERGKFKEKSREK
jgi:hypothetical protein